MGRKVKLTFTESRCRSGFHKKGEEYIIDDTICPPICMELWHYAYPYVWALLNGAEDDPQMEVEETYHGRLYLYFLQYFHMDLVFLVQ